MFLIGSNHPNTCLLEVSELNNNMSEFISNNCATDSQECQASKAVAVPDNDLLQVRLQVQDLRDELLRKRLQSQETNTRHEEELKRLTSLHKEEIEGLRKNISGLTVSIDKWKSTYTNDLTKLEKQLNMKDLELERTVRRSQ